MPLLDSFTVDHTIMPAPAVRIAKKMQTPCGDTITVFDLRFCKPNEEIMVEIDKGKTLLIKLLNVGEPNLEGIRQIVFQLNGQHRTIRVKDNNIESSVVENRKANGELEIGSPLQGKLFQILVKKGDKVKKGQIIGKSGKTGRITGPHLHYAMRLYNTTVNPLQYHELYNNILKKR